MSATDRLALSMFVLIQGIPVCVGLCYAAVRAFIRNRNK